jgi:ABC-type nitrate/sulfonate/bicarbonate transport system permease component
LNHSRFPNTLIRLALPAALVALWEGLVHFHVLNALLFPPPSRLLTAAIVMTESGELPRNLFATLVRGTIGFVTGSAAGLLCGLLMGASRVFRVSLEPLVSALYSSPKLTLLPMLMLLVGVGEPAGIILIAASCFTMTSIHCLDAVRNLNRAYVDLAANYGASRGAILRRVYLPGCLPEILTGLRLAVGRALVVTISVEMLASPNGLGSLIWLSWQTLMTEKIYVAALICAAAGALLHYLALWAETRLVPWKAVESQTFSAST